MISEKPIYVTKPSLCIKDEYCDILNEVWDSGMLTHNGPLLIELESQLNKFLHSNNMVVVVNGTTALQLAIRALDVKGEVITTPFSHIATCSAIQWEGCTPVFVDIDPDTLNIDPNKIEEAITRDTSAIMPVHTFSNPCDIESIQRIADRYNLKVIYDAAHAMSVIYGDRSIFEYGDISTVSFQATKLFNTGEGGGCIAMDHLLYKKLQQLRFFGLDENKNVLCNGLNGKMTELHAALGLANLRRLNEVIEDRRNKYKLYQSFLLHRDDIRWQLFDESSYNYSYMPLIFDTEDILMNVLREMNKNNVFPRRYFYPSLNKFEQLKGSMMPISEDVSCRIACFPLYYGISENTIRDICLLLIDVLDSVK